MKNWIGLLRWHLCRKNWTALLGGGRLCWHLCCVLLAGGCTGWLCRHWSGWLRWRDLCCTLAGPLLQLAWESRGQEQLGQLARRKDLVAPARMPWQERLSRLALGTREASREGGLLITEVLTARAAEAAPKGFVLCDLFLRQLRQLPKIIILPNYARQFDNMNYQNMLAILRNLSAQTKRTGSCRMPQLRRPRGPSISHSA